MSVQPHFEEFSRPRLSEDARAERNREIVRRWWHGETMECIGADVGLSRWTVKNIIVTNTTTAARRERLALRALGPRPPADGLLSSTEVAAFADISYRQLEWAWKRGIIDYPATRGSGEQRRWTEEQAAKVKALFDEVKALRARLKELGFDK